MNGMMQTLELYFVKKAPALPKGVKEFIVMIAPWLTILSVVFALPAIFALLGWSARTAWMPMMGYGYSRFGGGMSLAIIFLIATFILRLLAIPGLYNKKKMGWNYIYYSVLVDLAYSLFTFELFGLIIGALVCFYFLFQVKSYYK